MSNELEPCPFCGGETTIKSPDTETFFSNLPKIALVKCQKCGAVVSFNNKLCDAGCAHGDLSPTVDAYNTRYERTCHFFESFNRDVYGDAGAKRMLEEYLAPPQPATLSIMDLPDCYECSACGWQVKQEPPTWMKHCANCGAKVVRNGNI